MNRHKKFVDQLIKTGLHTTTFKNSNVPEGTEQTTLIFNHAKQEFVITVSPVLTEVYSKEDNQLVFRMLGCVYDVKWLLRVIRNLNFKFIHQLSISTSNEGTEQ